MSVLDAVGLSIRFGGLQALQDVSLRVGEFEIVGLIGPNGAGKTTAFNCITGFYRPDTGRVRFKDEDVSELPTHVRSALGMGRTFQQGGELLELRRAFEISILMIEHHVPLVVRICDYVYVINFGRLLTEGLPADVQSHPEVIAAYLGEEAEVELEGAG